MLTWKQKKWLAGSLFLLIVLLIFVDLVLRIWIFTDIRSLTAKELGRKNFVGEAYYSAFSKDPMNSGLPYFLQGPLARLEEKGLGENFVFLIAQQPKVTLDFASPQTLLKALMAKDIEPLDFGHLAIAWSCQVEGRWYQSGTGLTAENTGQAWEMVMQGWGATTAFASFEDGLLEPPWVVHIRSVAALENDHLAVLAIPVRSFACQRLLKAFWNFSQSPERKLFSLYTDGLKPDGKMFPGFNAMTFGSYMISQLELESDLFSLTKRNIHIPFRYMGLGKELPRDVEFVKELLEEVERGKGAKSSVDSLELGSWERWLAHQPGLNLSYSDPDLLVREIRLFPKSPDLGPEFFIFTK